MAKGLKALKDQIRRTTPWWEREDEGDLIDYEDFEDHPYNIMGAKPGQRYG